MSKQVEEDAVPMDPQEMEGKISQQSKLESWFEKSLWNCRFVVLIAVIFGLFSAIALFVLGGLEVISGIGTYYDDYQKLRSTPGEAAAVGKPGAGADASGDGAEHSISKKDKRGKMGLGLVGSLIGAVDYFLIGVVLLIFSFGIYELFISHLEIGRLNDEVKILEITSLDDLKGRIIKVVIMVLIVSFFKKVLSIDFDTPLDMLYFAGAIFVLCLGVYFMHKSD